MKPNVIACRHGRDATAALAGVIVDVKADDPFAKVTVLVPSNLAGLSARRLLGSGDLGGTGIANVDFVTPFRLAELLAPVRTPGRNPLTNPILAAAVRRVLAENPGRFAPVARHEATEAALVSLYEELSHTLRDTRDALAAASDHGASLIEMYASIVEALRAHEGEDDLLLMAASDAEHRADLDAVVGTLVWWLPDVVSPAVLALVRTLTDRLESHVVVGITGVDEADRLVVEVVERIGSAVPSLAADVELADRIISVSDADEEVRAVVREVLALLAEGVPLHRIGVFHPRPDPYGRTLVEQLAGSGIAHSGPSRRRLADLMAGRTLLTALDLAHHDYSRVGVMTLAATGPVRDAEGVVPQGRWERISRQAGVVGGLADWAAKLSVRVDLLEQQIVEHDRGDDAWAARRHDEIASTRRLGAFVEMVAGRVEAITLAPSWADKAAASAKLVVDLLGPENRRLHWPDEERDAAQRVDAALARLAVLDRIEPNPTDESFRRAVVAELDTPMGRVGRFGHGLVYGPLTSAIGQDLEAVFVLGMAEGTCPAPRAEDPLLNDGLRSCAVADELLTRTGALALQHRAFLAALAAAPPGTPTAPRRFLTFARGDLRSNRDRIPSRWLLPTASAMARGRVSTARFSSLDVAGVEVIASYAAGLLNDRPFTDAAEHETASMHRFVRAGGDPATHPAADGAVARGLDAAASRDAPRFTEWDGDLAGADLELPGQSRPASATRLQTWAACPFKYFLNQVLGLRDRDDPDEIVEIDARHRGSLMHEILEQFVRWAIDDRPDGPPVPAEAWNDDDRAQMATFAHEVMSSYETLGVTGRPLTWRLEQERIERELEAWMVADGAERAARGTVPVEVEMPFGFDDRPPLELTTAAGRVLRFHGYIDRVDRTSTGDLVVYDYKSSKSGTYRDLADDPVDAGATLQLGLYAEAAKAQHAPDAAVDARYWLMTTRGGNEKPGYPWTDDRRARFLDVAEAIVDGIEAGAFPANPGEYDAYWGSNENCGWCDFDSVCPKDRADHQAATFKDPRAAEVLLRLRPPTAAEPDPDAPALPGDPS